MLISLYRDCFGNPCDEETSCATEYNVNAVPILYTPDFGVETFRLLPGSALTLEQLEPSETDEIVRRLTVDCEQALTSLENGPGYSER